MVITAKSKLLRVTQMNAVYFDKEIQNVLQQHIQDFLKYLPPGWSAKFDHELNFLLRLAINYYSIIRHDCTFGQKLLTIKYDNLTKVKKGYLMFYTCLDYLRLRFEMWKPSHTINTYVHNINLFVQLLRLWNIALFLRGGAKPLLIERVLGLHQVYAKDNVHRHYEDKYMTRELIWNGFIEILVYLLPLINYHKISRILKHLNPLYKKPSSFNTKSRSITIDTKCAHCDESPIHPSHMGCEHIFCYTCLKGNQAADSKYECPSCDFYSGNMICEAICRVSC